MVWHRGFDVALGLSAFSWAVLGLIASERPWAVRIAIAALNATIGGLFLWRERARSEAPWRAHLAALPSMIFAGAAVRLVSDWTLVAQVVFVTGAACAAVCLVWLGRSFAFFPGRRALVESGPYGVIRHPAYASELLMVSACAITQPWPGALLLAGVLLTVGLRIRAEERVLAGDEGHAEYRARVRYRLLPGLW